MSNPPVDAETPTPWRADSLTNARTTHVTHLWHVVVGSDTVPAWDITVDLDERRNPHGIARMKMPANTTTLAFDPYLGYGLQVYAGWRHTTGSPLDDEHLIFRGIVTAVQHIRRTNGDSYVQVEARTSEAFWDHPLKSGSWDVSNSHTTMAQLITAMNAAPTQFYRTPIDLVTDGTLPTPTSAQLAVFRAMVIAANEDSLDDWWHLCADSLGLWWRGDSRGRAGGTHNPASTALVVSADYDADDTGHGGDLSVSLDGLWSQIEREEGPEAADWANWVELTAKWRSSGSWVDTTRLYGADSGGGIMRIKKATIYGKPPGGVLSADFGTGLRYANAAVRREWLATIQARALWWLEPKQFVRFTADPQPTDTGQISAITYQVDAGTMTVRVRPGNYVTN